MKQPSEWSKKVTGHYPIAAFKALESKCRPENEDLYAFVRTHILEGIPHAFTKCPLAYDKIRYFIASELKLHHNDISLTGSAKLGFSLAPDKWLQEYLPESSDLDIFVISETLFSNLSSDYNKWKEDYEHSNISPHTEREKQIWDDNIRTTARTIRAGFINPRLISTSYTWSSRCENVCVKLPTITNNHLAAFGISLTRKRGSLRIYKDRISAINRIYFNITHAISEMSGYGNGNPTLSTPLKQLLTATKAP